MDWPLGKKDWRGRERSWGDLLGPPGASLSAPLWLCHPHPMLRLGPGPRSQKEVRQRLLGIGRRDNRILSFPPGLCRKESGVKVLH